MTDEERLLVLSTFAAPDVQERAELCAPAGRALDWPGLFDLAEVNATAPLVCRRLAKDGLLDTVPAGVRDAFADGDRRGGRGERGSPLGGDGAVRRFTGRGSVRGPQGGVVRAEIYRDPGTRG